MNSNVGPRKMQTPRLVKLSCISGVGSLAAIGVALILFELFPAAPGHRSAAFSEVGGVLLLLSTLSFVLAPVALVTGIKALRRLPLEADRRHKIAAWVGVTTGGLYSAVLLMPLLVFAWK